MIGDWYRHLVSGADYVVVLIATDESTLKERCIYQAFDRQAGRHGIIWDRPLSEFLDGRFTHMGTFLNNVRRT